MTKYRETRSDYDDSMATTVEVTGLAGLITYLQDQLGKYGISVPPEYVHVEKYMRDSRNGWNTYIVTIEDYGVAGFTDGPLT